MKRFFLFTCCLLLLCENVFPQGTVPDYITETLKKYHKDKEEPGVFMSYNFDEAKNKPNEVIALKLIAAGLKNVPNEIEKFKNIEILDLSDNQISDVPIWLLNLKRLKKLIIRSNKLENIPSFLFAIKSINFLDVSDNKIKTISIPEMNTSNLKELDLSFNHLSQIPNSLSKLNMIQSLSVRHNRLSSIPNVIFNMTHLRYLSLNDNQIADFDDAIRKATSLQALTLIGNELSESQIKKLRVLLPNCKIVTVMN